MRILIGTLYVNENEFPECVASIKRQTHQDIEHFVIEGLPEREAHNALYQTFMSRSDEFDLFMKIDADMVLEDENLLADIVEQFQQLPDHIDILTIPVFDMFLHRPILGMHTFRSSVKWPQVNDNLFTDKHPVPPSRRITERERYHKRVTHCKNPLPFHAFHFGMHRGIKLMKSDIRKRPWQALGHWNSYETVKQNFWKFGDLKTGFATLGYELAFAGKFSVQHISYTNPFAAQVFEQYADWDVQAMKTELRRLNRKNGGWLPSLLHFAFIKYRAGNTNQYQNEDSLPTEARS